MRLTPYTVYPRVPRRMPYTLGFDRYALYFGGEGDYVEAPGSPSLDMTGKKVALEAMIKLHGPGSPDASRIIRVGDQVTFGVSNDGYRLGGWVYVDGWQGGWGESGYSLELYKWYHVMMIWDETARRYHVNGQHVKSVSFTGSINGSAGPTRVGGWPDESPQWFNGLIAFVRVYDERLFNWLGEQGKTIDWFVKYNMLNYHSPVRAGLVLWLDFEEGHGDKAYDKSGQGNHGTIHGATWVRVGQYELRAEVGL